MEKAIEYAEQYVQTRNPHFLSFENNCINFVSQCLVAGGIEMDGPTPNIISSTKIVPTTNKWFCYDFETDPYKPFLYYASSSFLKLNDFISYWSRKGGVSCTTLENTEENREIIKDNVNVGDVLVLHSFFSTMHSAIISKIISNEIYYISNSNDRANYPLSSVSEKEYNEISYLKFVK